MHRIALTGLVALAAALGGIAVPAGAATRPTTATLPAVLARPAGLSQLDGTTPKVSCVTPTDCLGIKGSSSMTTGTTTPLRVARWNGSSWASIAVKLPGGTQSLDLDSVSCSTAKSCMVVGDYYTSTSPSAGRHLLALSYNGTSLRPTSTVPLPKSVLDATLISVSCVTAEHCVAVGIADNTMELSPLIETWDGTDWTLNVPVSHLGDLAYPEFVSCTASDYCVIAGEALTSSGQRKLYIASWNGTTLTTMKLEEMGGNSSELEVTGVSCGTPSNCVVSLNLITEHTGGVVTSNAYTEVWNGVEWRTVSVPWPLDTTISFLMGVSCRGAHVCDVAGMVGGLTTPSATVASYHDGSWKLQPVPRPGSGRLSFFTSVSCLSAVRCVTVGELGPESAATHATMTGVWNGLDWRLHPGF